MHLRLIKAIDYAPNERILLNGATEDLIRHIYIAYYIASGKYSEIVNIRNVFDVFTESLCNKKQHIYMNNEDFPIN